MNETAIYNPIYNEHQRYLHHKCSECGYEIDLDEAFIFEIRFKYCPNCARPIIRYGQPIFETKPDFSWLEPYKEVWEEYEEYKDKVERHLKYLKYIKLNDNTQSFNEKLEVTMAYLKNRKSSSEYKLCEALSNLDSFGNLHYTEVRKLTKEFEEE